MAGFISGDSYLCDLKMLVAAGGITTGLKTTWDLASGRLKFDRVFADYWRFRTAANNVMVLDLPFNQHQPTGESLE